MSEKKVRKVQWHPAFAAALQIELEEFAQYLSFEEEHLLSKKPLQMDVLVIKNPGDVEITKNLGRIFRRHNIVEYKSPEDSLTVDDFYKVYAYACLYKSEAARVNEIRADEMTITFACYHYPREMLSWIKKERGITVMRQGDGIYYLTGDAIPIQLILVSKLSKEDNYWMQTLRNDLNSSAEIRDLILNYDEKKYVKNYQAVMDAVVRANQERMEAEKYMCDALRELFAVELEKITSESCQKAREEGLLEGQQEGRQKGRLEGQQEGLLKGRQEGRQEGRLEGQQEGLLKGETIMGTLMQTLLSQKKYDEASRAARDVTYRQELYKKYNIQTS